MKRLLTLLFALAVAFSLTMPAFAQEAAGGQEQPKKEETGKKGHKGGKKGHHKGGKKGKKGSSGEGTTPPPK